MSIRPDVLALPRRYLWLMYHESITQSQVGVELLGQLKLHRKKDILHLYQDLQHFSFGRASGLGKRSLHLWCIQTRRNYFKISNEAKREYSEGFVLQHFYFWKKSPTNILTQQHMDDLCCPGGFQLGGCARTVWSLDETLAALICSAASGRSALFRVIPDQQFLHLAQELGGYFRVLALFEDLADHRFASKDCAR